MNYENRTEKQTIGKNARLFHWILAIAVMILSVFLGSNDASAADALDVSAQYDSSIYKKELEIILNIESTSEISVIKYLDAHVVNPRYFTKYPQKGTAIKQDKKGKYSFTVKENGTYSVYVANVSGEESLITIKIRNIDNEAPNLSIESKKMTGFCSVTLRATDNIYGNISVKYVQGAHSDLNDSAWASAPSFKNEKSLLLTPGKYSFLLTDNAGNSRVVIENLGATVNVETNEEFKAVWIAYLAFKSSGYTKQEFTKHIETMFDDVVAMNMNAVVVHVRPFGDAMYESKYFPWSKYVSGKQGKNPGFDPLEIMIKEAHERGLEFHAWLNPYRITSSSTNVMDLSTDNPARIYLTDQYKGNDRNVLTYDGKLYYNPASTQVQNLIVNGIKEIVENYDVDGIHFDDYFYPALGKNFTKIFDAQEYNEYARRQRINEKEALSIADWRRENVNKLVRKIYSAVKEINSDVVFGISPGGFIDALKANDKYYVDFETWLGYDGYIDYLCPQLYWSNDHSVYPFNDVLNRFINAATNPDVKLYVGVGAYKSGIKTEGTEWYQNENVLRNMIRYARSTGNVDGFIVYSYNYLISKKDHKAIKNMLKEFK